MQKLTEEQANAILDLVEQCRVVTSTYEQAGAISRSDKAAAQGSERKVAATVTERKHKEAMSLLIDYYVVAEGIHVGTDILDGVLGRNLPSGLTVKLSTAA